MRRRSFGMDTCRHSAAQKIRTLTHPFLILSNHATFPDRFTASKNISMLEYRKHHQRIYSAYSAPSWDASCTSNSGLIVLCDTWAGRNWMEIEEKEQPPFLDVLSKKKTNGKFGTRVCRKSIYTLTDIYMSTHTIALCKKWDCSIQWQQEQFE